MPANVLVVGAGPVGLTMAAELARYGVPVRIIDQNARRTDKSKALVVWSRTLELIDRMGLGEDFVAAGHKVHAANIITGAKILGHIRLDRILSPHAYALMLPQSETERLMEEHLSALGVRVERQVELLRFSAASASVTATLRGADGSQETIEAACLIGCDGAHSTVRRELRLSFEGDTMPTDWILADAHLAGVPSAPDELNLYWHPDGALGIFPITPGRYRVIADVGEAGEADPGNSARRPDPTLAEVQAILDRRGPGGIRVSNPIWLSSFRINERKVRDYRAGRVFLAGDAAHIHRPAGGQGMNTGMQDAFNFAWKLALVCRGLAEAEPLLDSYSIERSGVGRQVLQDAGRLTKLAIMRGGMAQKIRNAIACMLLRLPIVHRMMADKLSELWVAYRQSPLTAGGHPPRGAPAAGQRAPIIAGNKPFGSGPTPQFTLCAGAPPPDFQLAGLLERHRAILDPKIRPPFAPGGFWLIRPDGYVALAGKGNGWNEVVGYLSNYCVRS